MNTLPLLSIITPTYNREELLAETIDSVLNQDYPNVEYVVVNDGSSDGTSKILEKYAKRISIINQPNQGQPKAINNGLKKVKGQWTAVVSSDDPLYPYALSTIMNYLSQNDDVIAVYPDWHMIDKDGFIIDTIRTPEYNYQNMLRRHICIPGPCSFIRTDVFKTIGGYNPDFPLMPDYEFWLKAGLYGNFIRVPKVLATWRIHQSSISISGRNKEMALERIRMINFFFNTYKNHSLFSDKKIKAQAYSSAYYIAAFNSLKENSLRNEYLFQAFMHDPTILFRILYDVIVFIIKKSKMVIKRRLKNHWKDHIT